MLFQTVLSPLKQFIILQGHKILIVLAFEIVTERNTRNFLEIFFLKFMWHEIFEKHHYQTGQLTDPVDYDWNLIHDSAFSGKYWYECRRGELYPMGCFSEDNQRLEVGQTYKKDGYAMTCNLG